MVFAAPVFLYAFLPLIVAAYLAAPRRAKNAVLLVGSIAFYAWGEGAGIAVVLVSVLANWCFGLMIGKSEGRARSRWLALAVALNLALLALFKYTNFLVANLDGLAQALGLAGIAATAIPLPLGISFFTFHAISYVVDVYKRSALAEPKLSHFALYLLLFPQLIAGPIIRWRDIAAQLGTRAHRQADIAWGVRRFVLGLGKKVLIANTLGQVADRVFALPGAELTTPLAWLGLACYTLQIYFDFSGYSDMAIGLMRMFGFRILENFNLPYVSQSIREFWRRWHISLSNWFRDYLYVPLGGNRRGAARGWANLVVVFLLCGLWHGASWPFVLWGAWHGLFLVAERAGLERALLRIGRARHVYALAAVMGGWVLFRCETLAQALAYYGALMGAAAGDPLRQPLQGYADPLVLTTLAAGIVGATALPRRLGALRDAVADRGGIVAVLALYADVAWLACVGVAAAAWLAAGTYNPFIYFRF